MPKSGTSMATRHGAGAAALYLESHADALPSEVAPPITANATSRILNGISGGSPNLLLFTGGFSLGNPIPPTIRPAVTSHPSPRSHTAAARDLYDAPSMRRRPPMTQGS